MNKKAPEPPVLIFRGPSGAGKTLLIEKTIRILTRKGYRVGSLKHTAHGYDLDREGKDSWRHARAGAEKVVLAGPTSHAALVNIPARGLDELVRTYLWDVDIVLTEGYSKEQKPRVTLKDTSSGINLRYCRGKKWMRKTFAGSEVSVFADFVESEFLKKKQEKR